MSAARKISSDAGPAGSLPESPGLPGLGSNRNIIWCGLLFAITVAAYGPALRAGFIWDDDFYVTQNPFLRNLDGLWHIWFSFSPRTQYYPLVLTSFWAEYHVWGLNPLGYHLVNVGLHAVAAILLWRVLVKLGLPGAWLAAAIFAVHPIEVESVAWITERKNVLSAVFYLACTLFYLRFLELREAGAPQGRRFGFYASALLFFIAALLSKTVACSLPMALLLVRWWKQGRLRWNDAAPLMPFFAIGMGLGLTTIWIEKHYIGARGADWSLTAIQRGLIAGRALWFYAGKLAWPVSLSFIYPRWEINPRLWWQWLFPIAALALMAGLWWGQKRLGRGLLAAALFFAITLAPALGFVNVYPMRYSFVADHFQYLAGVGLIAAFAAALTRLPRVVQFAVLAVLGVLTWERGGAYRDVEALWRDTLAKNPDCWIAHNNLGLALETKGEYPDAKREYVIAQRIAPSFPETYNNLGNAAVRERDFETAMMHYRKSIELKPDYAPPLNSLGVLLAMRGQLDEAIDCFRRALRTDPEYARAHNNLGNALKFQGHFDEAIQEYAEAYRFDPDRHAYCVNLGSVSESAGKLSAAVVEYGEALKLAPNDENTLFFLARVEAQTGLKDQAVEHLRRALELRPGFSEAAQLARSLNPAPPTSP